MNNIVLIADPAVLAIPVWENLEPMVDLIEQTDIACGPPPLLPDNTNYTKMRKTIYEKLVQAQTLLPEGLKFCLYEAYRSLSLQQTLFQERYDKLKAENETWTHAQLFIETTKFVSPVINLDGTPNVPPHATGAAIDVYLLDKNGNVVDMGIHLDDTYNDLHATYCQTDSAMISDSAKRYRRIMCEVLQAVGFVNYPTEYWHWSYGDRYWAYHTKQTAAIYDIV